MRAFAALVSAANALPSPGRRRALGCAFSGAALLLAGAGLSPAWAQPRSWQTEPIRQQAKALLQR